MIAEKWPCPRCGATIETSGVLVANEQECSVFQCDKCTIVKPVFGEPFELALTFAVDDKGRAFDPVDDETFG